MGSTRIFARQNLQRKNVAKYYSDEKNQNNIAHSEGCSTKERMKEDVEKLEELEYTGKPIEDLNWKSSEIDRMSKEIDELTKKVDLLSALSQPGKKLESPP